MDVEAAVQEPVIRPRWSSTAFLFYLGVLVVLFATLGLLVALVLAAGGHREAAAAGWSGLALAVGAAAAFGLRRSRRDLLAGLAAFVGVVLLAVFAGSLVNWAGLGPELTTEFLQRSFEPGLYLVELVVIAGGLAALALFRFPLIVLLVVGTALYAAVDIGTVIVGGDSGAGVPALFAALAGATLVAGGTVIDHTRWRPYGFWLHLIGGLAIGQSLFYLSSQGELGWAAVAVGALAYVAAARFLRRSSYAALAAIGVLAVSSHWIGEWLGDVVQLPFFGSGGGNRSEPWQVALAYVGVGVVLVLLGALARRREEPDDVGAVVGERGDIAAG